MNSQLPPIKRLLAGALAALFLLPVSQASAWEVDDPVPPVAPDQLAERTPLPMLPGGDEMPAFANSVATAAGEFILDLLFGWAFDKLFPDDEATPALTAEQLEEIVTEVIANEFVSEWIDEIARDSKTLLRNVKELGVDDPHWRKSHIRDSNFLISDMESDKYKSHRLAIARLYQLVIAVKLALLRRDSQSLQGPAGEYLTTLLDMESLFGVYVDDEIKRQHKTYEVTFERGQARCDPFPWNVARSGLGCTWFPGIARVVEKQGGSQKIVATFRDRNDDDIALAHARTKKAELERQQVAAEKSLRQKLETDDRNSLLGENFDEVIAQLERLAEGSEDGPVLCEEDEFEYNGHCYLSSEKKQNFDDARAFCQERGGDLVAITDADENEFVASIGEKSWIGLRRHGESDYRWVTGEDYGYENWKPEKRKDRECAMIRNGQWESKKCAVQRPAICEFGRR